MFSSLRGSRDRKILQENRLSTEERRRTKKAEERSVVYGIRLIPNPKERIRRKAKVLFSPSMNKSRSRTPPQCPHYKTPCVPPCCAVAESCLSSLFINIHRFSVQIPLSVKPLPGLRPHYQSPVHLLHCSLLLLPPPLWRELAWDSILRFQLADVSVIRFSFRW